MSVMTDHIAWASSEGVNASQDDTVFDHRSTDLPDAPMAMPMQSLDRVRLSDLLRGLVPFGGRRARS